MAKQNKRSDRGLTSAITPADESLAEEARQFEAQARNAARMDAKAGLDPNSHFSIISEYGVEIVRGMLKVGDTYWKLCGYIRTNKVDADVVRKALEPLGFIKQRITEINRVANAPEELWSEYEARALSFRRTLELSRGTVQLLLDKTVDVDEHESVARTMVGVEAEEAEAEVSEAESSAGVIKEPESATVRKEKMEAVATRLAALAEKYSVKQRVFKIENGYVVTVSRAPGKAPKTVGAPKSSAA